MAQAGGRPAVAGKLATVLSRCLPTLAIAALLFSAALGRVALAHWERSLNAALQESLAERDRIDSEWSRLLIEEATLGDLTRVEQQAREQLDMVRLAESDRRVVMK